MPKVRDGNPDLPKAIDDVLAKGLAKKKEDRHQTAAEFARAFRNAAESAVDDEAATLVTPSPTNRSRF